MSPSSKETRSASTPSRRESARIFEEGKDSHGNHQSEVCRVSAAAAVAPRRRRPPRRLDAGGGGAPPAAAPPPAVIPSTVSIAGPRICEIGGTPSADALSPARLDAHERCICEFEALKAESARIRDALKEVDASLASNAITECVASVRKASLTTAAQATRRRRAALLPAVRAAAAALGEYRSDMATSVASGW